MNTAHICATPSMGVSVDTGTDSTQWQNLFAPFRNAVFVRCPLLCEEPRYSHTIMRELLSFVS
jgi:hypothetical protein